MNAQGYMILGAMVAVPSIILQCLWPEMNTSIMTLAAGMMFGKGYGIWEVRNEQ